MDEEDINDYDFQAELIEHEYEIGILEWTTNDGDTLLVQNMTDDHLINARKMIAAKLSARKLKGEETDWDYEEATWMDVFTKELKKRYP